MKFCALLCLLFLFPQTKPETIPCTVVNFDPHPTLACKGYEKALEIPYAAWPVEWHGPELGFTYQIKVQRKGDDLFSGEFVRSQPDLEEDAMIALMLGGDEPVLISVAEAKERFVALEKKRESLALTEDDTKMLAALHLSLNTMFDLERVRRDWEATGNKWEGPI